MITCAVFIPLLLLFHADRTGGAFYGAYTAALAIAVINYNFMAVNYRFRTICPAKLALGTFLNVNYRTVHSPGAGVTAGAQHWPGNGPVGFRK